MEHLCRSCGARLRRQVLDLGAQPVSNALVSPADVHKGERYYPLKAMVCDTCHLAQLVDCPPSDVHFHDSYVYFSSYSQTWLQHCERYAADTIARFGLSPNDLILEIASNDGYLLKYFRQRGFDVLGIEPSRSVAEKAIEAGIPTEIRFFNRDCGEQIAARGRKPKLVAANNVLAHVPDLNDFVAGFPPILGPDSVLTCEVHYFRDLIEKTQFDSLYLEHYSYFTIAAVETLFARHGLRLFDVQRLPTHGGSLRVYACQKNSPRPAAPSLAAALTEEKAFLADLPRAIEAFQDRVFGLCGALREFLLQARREKRLVVGFGAPAKACTLLNAAGIQPGLLPYTVDNNPKKQGQLLPGVHIPIRPASALEQDKPRHVLILAWNLRDEIVERYAAVRSWGGNFVCPIPRLEIVP